MKQAVRAVTIECYLSVCSHVNYIVHPGIIEMFHLPPVRERAMASWRRNERRRFVSQSGSVQFSSVLFGSVRLGQVKSTSRVDTSKRCSQHWRAMDALISINGQDNTLMLAAQIKSRFRLTVKAALPAVLSPAYSVAAAAKVVCH